MVKIRAGAEVKYNCHNPTEKNEWVSNSLPNRVVPRSIFVPMRRSAFLCLKLINRLPESKFNIGLTQKSNFPVLQRM